MNEMDLTSESRSIAAALTGLFQEKERAFAKIGESLIEAMEGLGQLTSAFEALPAALDGQELHHASELLGSVAHAIAEIGQTLSDESSMLAELDLVNKEVAHCLERLRQSIRVMSILTLHAKIEASSIDDANHAFADFTVEIAQLAKLAQTTVEGYVAEHGKLASLLATACAEQNQFQRRYQTKLVTVVEELKAALSAVEERRQQTSRAAVEIARRSRQVGETAGLLVFDLQIGDTTRQRIEHVEEGLAIIAADLTPTDSRVPPTDTWGRGLSTPQRLAAGLSACAMMAAQICDAADDYDRKIDKIHGSLRELTHEAAGIARLGAELYGSRGTSETSFLGVLERRLSSGFEIIRDCSDALNSVDRATATVAAATAQLREQVSSIGQIVLNMQLVGMNAGLKSKQIGNSGRGLGAIAEQLRGYANETVCHADALMPALGKVIATTEKFNKKRAARGDDIMGRLDGEMAAALIVFEQCSGQLNRALAALSIHGEKVGAIIEESVGQVADQSGLAGLLGNVRTKLACLGGSDEAGAASPEATGPLMSQLSLLYTMAREREIHAQFAALGASLDNTSGDDGPCQSPAASREDDMILDDILFA